MTREQQGIALFLSLVLILVFALNETISPGTPLFRGPFKQNLPPEGPGPRVHAQMEEEIPQEGFNRLPARPNILAKGEKKGRGDQEQNRLRENLGSRNAPGSPPRVWESPDGKMPGDVRLSPIQKQILAIPININTAPIEELDALPGIGPQTAQAIIDFRARFGPFQSLEDLMKVRGIGPKKFSTLRPHITLQ